MISKYVKIKTQVSKVMKLHLTTLVEHLLFIMINIDIKIQRDLNFIRLIA